MIIVVNDKVAVDPYKRSCCLKLPGSSYQSVGSERSHRLFEDTRKSTWCSASHCQNTWGCLRTSRRWAEVWIGERGKSAPVPGTKPVMVFPWIAVTSEDAQTYQKITAYGYRITPKRTPADRDIDLVEELKRRSCWSSASSFFFSTFCFGGDFRHLPCKEKGEYYNEILSSD